VNIGNKKSEIHIGLDGQVLLEPGSGESGCVGSASNKITKACNFAFKYTYGFF
jgi:hypothetical protein